MRFSILRSAESLILIVYIEETVYDYPQRLKQKQAGCPHYVHESLLKLAL